MSVLRTNGPLVFYSRDKHESNHQPGLHKGVVIKINSNQRYASTAITNTILREIASRAQVPLQVVYYINYLEKWVGA